MSFKIILLLFAFSFLISCKKNKDGENCMVNIIDNNGNTVSTYTKTPFIALGPNGNWFDFVDNSENREFTDASRNYFGKAKKSCQ